ncbi:MFS transporter [Streptomyces eurocidicus]|uniref:EmrB/QacA subfamily drug resistance transporter n=1 Tax=Streptomyces eurocidicus TaxID=66423 RepID=A0A7W8F1P3_STREU|nr:MFS transporter [Streptomyces eurocidicus]MBB5117965.1 EmrB/QacA subfamily drug resistance transporter [Streptomyces eurocidicus]MBF6053944.1 DHA2 family efflux MFS transporter permease subunit [Streptomyces eurocidicus]
MSASPTPPGPRRWWALVVIAIAQLMVVLDATIVNIALPSAQRELHMSDGNRQWVITAYTLAFGGLLLLGGRIADLVGRKLTFMTGLLGFAGASALGGAAHTSGLLFMARALQGAFGALLAPSALSLLTTTFTDGKERGKAFGIYGAIAGGGAAIGLIAGGLLTEYLDWRWCLYVNIPIAVIAFLGALVFLHDDRRRREDGRPRLDIPGAVLGCGGLVAIVYGCSEAEPRGWGDPLVLGLLCGGVALLGVFAWWQSRARNPLLPLHVLRDRNRAGSFLVMGLAVIAMFGMFLFMTYYLQVVLGYSPVRTGLAFLPMTAAIILGSTQISARLMTHVPPRTLMVPGAVLAACGLFLLTFLTAEPAYVTHVLPAELLVGLGMGLIFMPVMATATAGVAPQDAGVTSATVNTAQQVGGSIGTALLNTIATTASTTYITAHLKTAAATSGGQLTAPVRDHIVKTGVVHGFNIAIAWGAGIMLLAGAVGWLLVTTGAPKHASPAGDLARPSEAAVEAAERHHMRAYEEGEGNETDEFPAER